MLGCMGPLQLVWLICGLISKSWASFGYGLYTAPITKGYQNWTLILGTTHVVSGFRDRVYSLAFGVGLPQGHLPGNYSPGTVHLPMWNKVFKHPEKKPSWAPSDYQPGTWPVSGL